MHVREPDSMKARVIIDRITLNIEMKIREDDLKLFGSDFDNGISRAEKIRQRLNAVRWFRGFITRTVKRLGIYDASILEGILNINYEIERAWARNDRTNDACRIINGIDRDRWIEDWPAVLHRFQFDIRDTTIPRMRFGNAHVPSTIHVVFHQNWRNRIGYRTIGNGIVCDMTDRIRRGNNDRAILHT